MEMSLISLSNLGVALWGKSGEDGELATETAVEKQSYVLSAVKQNIYLRFRLTE